MGLKAVANVGGGGGGGTVTGSGTPGKIAKFATASSVGDSLLSESGTTITSAATAETFTNAQTWTVGAPNSQALVVLSNAGAERTLVLDTISRAVGVGVPTTPSTLLHVSDGVTAFAGTTGAGVRLDRATEALFSSSDGTRSLRAGLTGGTAVVGTSTATDLLLQRGNVTAITLGASGAVAFAGNLTSSAAQTWTLATSTTALNIQSGLLNLDTTNSRVGIGTTSPATTLEAYATATGEVRASSDVFSVVSSYTFNNTTAAVAPSIKLSRARGTRAVPVAVNALDTIGTIGWNAQGTTDHQIANIQCTAPANAGADAISSQLTFATSLTSDVLPVVRFTIDPAGVASFAGPVRATGTAATAPAFTGSDTDTGIYFPAANQVRISTSGTVAISVDASQNVGIGTTSPGASSRLAVAGGFIATAAGYGLYQPGDHLALNAGVGKNVYLKPNDGGLLAVNVGATSCDFTGVANYGLKLQSTPGNTDPNTLDCYAEGTWTPTLSAAATWGGAQPTVATARYVRIGSTVHCTVVLVGAPNFSSTYLSTTITAPFSAAYNAAVPISSGATAFGCAQLNAGATTIFMPTFGVVGAATLSWTFIV